MTSVFGAELPLPPILAGTLLLILFGALGWMAGRLAVWILARGVRHTKTDIDDVVLKAVGAPVCAAGALAGVWLALRGLDLPEEFDPYLNRGWIFLATFLLMSIGLRTINGLSRDILAKSPTLAGSATMVRVVGRVIIISMGGVMLLQSIGIAVEPLIASLGIGSLALGLALKDSLTHFVAGVYLFADRPIHVGDYIRLESGEEGFVHQIGWRATRIRMLSNTIVIVPNARLADAVLVNYDQPTSDMGLVIPYSVSYSSDPERVAAILLQIANEAIGQVPGLLGEPAPFVRFSALGDNSLDYSLIVRIATFTDQYLVKSELNSRVFARLSEEGIEIPFPQRTIHVPDLAQVLGRKSDESEREGSG